MAKTIIPAHPDETALVIWGDAEKGYPAEYKRVIAWVVEDDLQPIFPDRQVEASEYCLVFLSDHEQSWTEMRLGETVADTKSAIDFAKDYFQQVQTVATPKPPRA